MISMRLGTLAEARPFLALACTEKCSTTMGAEALRDVVRGAAIFIVEEFGEPVAAWALQAIETEAGPVAWISAAGGAAGVDLTGTVLPLIENACREGGFIHLAFATRRRGLEEKAMRLGFKRSSVELRKDLR